MFKFADVNSRPVSATTTEGQSGWLVGWLMESLYSYEGGDSHKNGDFVVLVCTSVALAGGLVWFALVGL